MASALFSERMWKEQPPSFSTQKPKCDIFFYTYLSRDGFYHLPWIHNLPQPVQTTLAAPRPSSLNACQASLENSRLLPSADLLSLSFFLLLLSLFTPHKGVLWPTSTTEDFIQSGEWMDGWIDGWMIQILIHKSQGGTPRYSGHFLGLPLLKISSPMGNGWMDVCMNKGG